MASVECIHNSEFVCKYDHLNSALHKPHPIGDMQIIFYTIRPNFVVADFTYNSQEKFPHSYKIIRLVSGNKIKNYVSWHLFKDRGMVRSHIRSRPICSILSSTPLSSWPTRRPTVKHIIGTMGRKSNQGVSACMVVLYVAVENETLILQQQVTQLGLEIWG